MATIAVLGAGIMASSLATPLADNGHRMRLVGTHLDRDIIASIQETGVHPNLGLKLPEGTPLLSVERVAYTYDDKPVEWRRGLCSTADHYYLNTLN